MQAQMKAVLAPMTNDAIVQFCRRLILCVCAGPLVGCTQPAYQSARADQNKRPPSFVQLGDDLKRIGDAEGATSSGARRT